MDIAAHVDSLGLNDKVKLDIDANAEVGFVSIGMMESIPVPITETWVLLLF